MTGRYAPSPTGTLHLGNLRTALAAWLFARAARAEFLVRAEDLDRGRSRERFVGEQLADLAAIGLDWDGEPIRQSQRTAHYSDAIEQLARRGIIYECFCTRREVREAASAPHGALPEGVYPGTCRDLSAEQREHRRAEGRTPALRVRADGATVAFTDVLAGKHRGVVDDFVIRRADGAYAYNLAVVVDDAAQSVTQVVRGADLLESVPRQRWLAQTLGLEAPDTYAHVPLVLGPDGQRLAKRHGAVTLADCAAAGQDAAAVRGRLLHSLNLLEHPDERPTDDELLARFDPARLTRASALLSSSAPPD